MGKINSTTVGNRPGRTFRDACPWMMPAMLCLNKQKQFKSHLAKQFSNFLMTLICCGFLRKKERKESNSKKKKENGTISGKSFIKTILDEASRQRVWAQWKRLIDTSIAACSEAINNFDSSPSYPPAPSSLSLKQTIKNLLKKSRRKITHKLLKKQRHRERERKKVACHMVEGTPRSIHWERSRGTNHHHIHVQAHKLKYRPAPWANVSI